VPDNDERLDVAGELGVSRRDLLRRGAVAGGELLWIAPAIQSVAAPAYANAVSPAHRTCCSCTVRSDRGFRCGQDHFTYQLCLDFCGGASNVKSYETDAECDAEGHCVPIS
jgi:hypothetical protein